MSALPRSSSYSLPKSYSYSQFTVNDWMKAIRTPTPYRVGNTRVQLKPRMVAYVGMFVIAVIILFIYFIPSTRTSRFISNCNRYAGVSDFQIDTTYPLSNPVKTSQGLNYRIAIVTDLDTDSKSNSKSNTWLSYLKYGNLTIADDMMKVSVVFDKDDVTLSSRVSEGGRGMELSELIVFNGKLYTVDDRTGIVFEIIDNKVVPWVILIDGNGKESKGNFLNKCTFNNPYNCVCLFMPQRGGI